MRSWIRARRWSIMVVMAALAATFGLSLSCLVPNHHEVAFQSHMRDSLRIIEASLPKAREEWLRLNHDKGEQNVGSMGLASLDSLLTTCDIDHEPLKAVAENGRTSLSVTFKGTSHGLHRAWREMSGWQVVDWSLQACQGGVCGTFRLESSAKEGGS